MRCTRSAAVLLSLTVVSGCSTYTSTYLGDKHAGATTRGLPIVVKRPRWMAVTHSTVTMGKPDPATPGAQRTWSEDRVEAETLYSDELFALDVNRPGAGQAQYRLDFPVGRAYPTIATATITDDTFRQSVDLVAELLKAAKGGGTQSPESAALKADQEDVRELGRVVHQIDVFDVRDVDPATRFPRFVRRITVNDTHGTTDTVSRTGCGVSPACPTPLRAPTAVCVTTDAR